MGFKNCDEWLAFTRNGSQRFVKWVEETAVQHCLMLKRLSLTKFFNFNFQTLDASEDCH